MCVGIVFFDGLLMVRGLVSLLYAGLLLFCMLETPFYGGSRLLFACLSAAFLRKLLFEPFDPKDMGKRLKRRRF